MMPGRFSSRTIIILCFTLAICTLFLRNIIYHNLHFVEIAQSIPDKSPPKMPITLAYHERPPYYLTSADKTLGGLAGEVAYNAFQLSGLEFNVSKLPPKRQLNNIQNNSFRICGVGWFLNPKRSLFANFTDSIYQDRPLAILTRKDLPSINDDFTLHQLLASKDLRILVKNSYSYGQQLDAELEKTNNPLINTTGSPAHMLEMIRANKADYFFLASEEAATLLAESPEPDQFRLVALKDMPPGNNRYIMCSKLVTKEEIGLINEGITKSLRTSSAGSSL